MVQPCVGQGMSWCARVGWMRRLIFLSILMLGRFLAEWVRLPMFRQKIVGEWVGDHRSQYTQDKSSKKEWHGVGHDLLIDRAETHIVPVESWTIRSSEQEGSDPVGGAEDRNYCPGIVEVGACHKGKEVEPQCPGADNHNHRV